MHSQFLAFEVIKLLLRINFGIILVQGISGELTLIQYTFLDLKELKLVTLELDFEVLLIIIGPVDEQ